MPLVALDLDGTLLTETSELPPRHLAAVRRPARCRGAGGHRHRPAPAHRPLGVGRAGPRHAHGVLQRRLGRRARPAGPGPGGADRAADARDHRRRRRPRRHRLRLSRCRHLADGPGVRAPRAVAALVPGRDRRGPGALRRLARSVPQGHGGGGSGPHPGVAAGAGGAPGRAAAHRPLPGRPHRAGAPGHHKAWGLERLAGHPRHPRTAVWAVGDADNDREMVQWAGHGCAMGHAPESLRRLARHLLPDIHQQGLDALPALVLGG